MGSPRSDHQLAVFGKVVTIVIGVLGIIVAWDDQRKIFDFVLYAWSGLGAAFGPTLLCLLYYKRTTWAGVIAGMIAGFATSRATSRFRGRGNRQVLFSSFQLSRI